MSGKTGVILAIIIIVAAVLKSALFVVDEGKQAIITRFGKPLEDRKTDIGLNFKTPFLEDVRYVEKRILSWDGYPSEIPTKDKKFIKVDTTARWKITDPLKFIQTVQNERGAKARLDAILDSTTRNVISNHNLVEAVRNSNKIFDQIAAKKKEIKALKEKGLPVVDEEISGEIEEIYEGREKLSTMIVEQADKELEILGIKLIDVQLRRISYETSVEKKVYQRMISERQRIAQKIQSYGQGERAKIEGRLARDLRKIESEAYRKAQAIRGQAQAKATTIYAKSLNQDPKFYEFVRSLEAYSKSLRSNAKYILSSDSDFLQFLKKFR